jgi:long-subunit acyl-CoA synthetase (AMP-forming)
MPKVKNQQGLLKKFKKQVSFLKRKEKASRNKLRSALLKVNKLIKANQTKLNRKAKEVKAKLAAAEAAVYEKLAKTIKNRAKKVKKVKKAVKKMALVVHKPKVNKRRKPAKS